MAADGIRLGGARLRRLGDGMPSMRLLVALGLSGLGLVNGGCALVTDGIRVTTNRTKESFEDTLEWKRDLRWAEDAWLKLRDQQVARSADYAAGFREGFANYVYRGGNGEPPPLPPKHYRTLKYQTPKGYQAIEDWFEGYRFGASMARDSGCRQLVTGPAAGGECGPSVCQPLQAGSSGRMVVGAPPGSVEPPATRPSIVVSGGLEPRTETPEPPVDGSVELPATVTLPERKPHARITAVHALSDPLPANVPTETPQSAATGDHVPETETPGLRKNNGPKLPVITEPERMPHARITAVHTLPDSPDPRPQP